jgi:AraC-like DNA-binding protein
MPGSAHTVFDDPFCFQSAIRAANVDFSIRSAGHYCAELTRVDFNQLWLQRGSESLARVAHAANIPNRAPILFLADPDQASMHHSGMELSTGEIAVYARSAVHHHWTSGPVRWAAMSLEPDALVRIGSAVTGRELTMPAATRKVRPKPRDLSRLRALHEAAGQVAKTTPNMFENDEVVRAVEHSLLHAMISCLVDSDRMEMTTGCRSHLGIVSRLEEFLITNPDRPLYLAEVCAATGASERTLRVSCHEHLGMGPIKYLWLRRMHLVRRILLRANPQTATVTDVATDHGFWELGRFSVAYRRLFGEMPSDSLRRSGLEVGRSDRDPLRLPDSENA